MHSLKIVESDTVLLMETSTFGLGRHRDTRRWYAWPAPMWGANEQRYWLVNTLWWFYMPPTTQTDSSLTEQANTDIKNQNLSNMSLPFGPLINVSKWTLSISESLLSRAEPDRRLSWVIHAHRSTRMERSQNDKLASLVSEAISATQPSRPEKSRVFFSK